MAADQDTNAPLNDLVVIGSSAGGIEALSILVSSLRPDFPAPIVLAQHLDPSRPSGLKDILQRRTSLAVEVVTSPTRLEPGKIYVVPSNRHVTISDSHVELQEDHQARPRPSVDLLLSTAAAALGERLTAVILTGSGSDGAMGAVDVKRAGGTVIVQNPQTARYPSMPGALPPTLIDFQTDIENLGTLLHDLLAGVRLSQAGERAADALKDILGQVGRQANIDFRPYKTGTILRRIGRRMAVTRSPSTRDYAQYLQTHPEEITELVKAFLINVTQFFRDPDAFAYLKSDLLPELIAQARPRDRVLRFWSAGCASGEEPYSLAMVLADLLGAELPEWNIRIFATDLDEAAVTFARRGVYPTNMLEGVPDEYQGRFLERVDSGFRIAKALREMVTFGHQDLSRSAPFPRINLILCRNLLIYFTPQLQDYVLNQFAFSICPTRGYLFLGKAETMRPGVTHYELLSKQWKIYRCVRDAPPVSRRQAFPALARAPGPIRDRPSRQSAKQVEAVPGSTGDLRHLNESLLRFLPVGVVVIDRAYRLVMANAPARRDLGLRDVAVEQQDFLHAARGIPYEEVRAAIDTVFRERSLVTLPEVALDLTRGGNGRFLSLSIMPVQPGAGAPDLATISVSDITEQVETRRQLEAARAEQAQLVHDLGTANRRLNDLNKELIDANEELQ
ncbi:MAG: PAS domain-containing protein, partial [Chloroflexota bacterium]|nr:PAS domain-containing protein [Chloroflexota bacterium]